MQILTMEKGAQGITDQQSTTPKNSVKLPHHQKDIQCPGSFDKEVQTNTKQAVQMDQELACLPKASNWLNISILFM